jgi:hypothetical protein
MFDAAIKALIEMVSPPFRQVLLKSIGLALALIVLIGIAFGRVFSWLATSGAAWAEAGTGLHAAWQILAWMLSIAATLGILGGALFLMPAVTAFVGSFFVDEIADDVERTHYWPGRRVRGGRAPAGVATGARRCRRSADPTRAAYRRRRRLGGLPARSSGAPVRGRQARPGAEFSHGLRGLRMIAMPQTPDATEAFFGECSAFAMRHMENKRACSITSSVSSKLSQKTGFLDYQEAASE